ncbi:MAG TPA: serine hydrolase [Arthrobacter sp.]|nr:serine hydrolase [Arthrobacter sp.]
MPSIKRRPIFALVGGAAAILLAVQTVGVAANSQPGDEDLQAQALSRASQVESARASGQGGAGADAKVPESDLDEQQFSAAMDEYAAVTGKTFSAAVYDPATDKTWTYNARQGYMEASIVKVSMVLTLIREATAEGRGLTSEELDLSARMIQSSDNDATNELYRQIGGAEALQETYDLLALTGTEAGPLWGASTTTAADQLKIVNAVIYGTDWLNEDQLAYLQKLMNGVEASQYWGVPSGTTHASVALKNGWLQDDDGKWDVNSIGYVTEDSMEYGIAVLSSGNPEMEDGVSLIEDVAGIIHELERDDAARGNAGAN